MCGESLVTTQHKFWPVYLHTMNAFVKRYSYIREKKIIKYNRHKMSIVLIFLKEQLQPKYNEFKFVL